MKIFIVFGGFVYDTMVSGRYISTATTEIFDPSVGSWRAGAAMPGNSPRAVNIDNRVLIFGKMTIREAFKEKKM